MNKYTLWWNMEYEAETATRSNHQHLSSLFKNAEVDYMNSYGINVECVKSDPIGKTYLATTNANPTRGIQWIEENPGPDHLFSSQDLYILKFVSRLEHKKPVFMIWKALFVCMSISVVLLSYYFCWRASPRHYL